MGTFCALGSSTVDESCPGRRKGNKSCLELYDDDIPDNMDRPLVGNDVMDQKPISNGATMFGQNGHREVADSNGHHYHSDREGSPSGGELIHELHEMTNGMMLSPSPIPNGHAQHTAYNSLHEMKHSNGLEGTSRDDLDLETKSVDDDTVCETEMTLVIIDLPNPIRKATESDVKYDAVEEGIAKQIEERYAAEFKQHPSVERMHLVHRFTTGFRHIKKKKRFSAICKDFDIYWEMHQRFDFDRIILQESSEPQKRAWKQFLYGQDHYGHPIMWDLIGSADLDLLKEEFLPNDDYEDVALRHIFLFMRKVENLKIQCSLRYGVTIYMHIQVLDMSKFTSDHMRGKNKKLTKLVINTLSRVFPEGVYKMYIINAPWPFRACWGLVKNFMDPITVQKTKVLGDDFLKEMLKEVPIEMIPPEYGGKGKWKIKYGGVPDEYPIEMNALTGLD